MPSLSDRLKQSLSSHRWWSATRVWGWSSLLWQAMCMGCCLFRLGNIRNTCRPSVSLRSSRDLETRKLLKCLAVPVIPQGVDVGVSFPRQEMDDRVLLGVFVVEDV